jgi:GTP-binding protein EngB required for normal cell division
VTANTIGMTGLPHPLVPARLASLTELTRLGAERVGPDGFSQELLTDSEALLRRSGERMRMSASHTVVALAGGTGSGKSSLFNALAGANFSPAGVTRPTTKHLHACVWGMEGAAPLLDWLGVQRRHRYARASALDAGEAQLTGLLLLDLPDHDSVVTGSAAMVDRLVKLADMLVWVLDPLKYADASVHRRYLVPLAGHASVTTVVFNQSDTLTPEQVADCESDLRRLLDSEGLADTPVLVTSATTGAGLDDLRLALASSVVARRAATDRIAADVDALLERFAAYAGDPVSGWQPGETQAVQLSAAPTVDAAPSSAKPAKAESRPPWEQDAGNSGNGSGDPNGSSDPSATTPRELRPPWQDAVPAAQDGQPDSPEDWPQWESAPAAASAAASAPKSRPPWEDATPDGAGSAADHEDYAGYVPPGPAGMLTTAFAKAAGVEAVTETLHGVRERKAAGYIGWPLALLGERLRGRTPARKLLAGDSGEARPAQRSDIDNAITVFADQIGGSLPEPWSRTVRAAARSRANEAQAALGAAVSQGLPRRDKVVAWWRLIALAQWLLMLLTLAGLVWIALILALHPTHKSSSSLVSDVSLTPWLGVMVVALLLLGWLISSWCQNMVVLAADREREQAVQTILSRVADATSDLVLVPAGRELADYERFRTQLAAARAPVPAA